MMKRLLVSTSEGWQTMRPKKYWFTVSSPLTVLAMVLAVPAGAFAATKVLYKFKGGTDGGHPFAGLVFDGAGNLYGTTLQGGGTCNGVPCGTVFELTANSDGSWSESVLHRFAGGSDGEEPFAGLTFDGAGNLYGTTGGGSITGGGSVFKMKPNFDGSWTESVLYGFCSLTQCADGEDPEAGVIFDGAGNLYGTTYGGGASGVGTVFKLTPNSNGSWAESVLHSFGGPDDGTEPVAALVFDAVGNLYGTTSGGLGKVFELTPHQDGNWTESVLHSFTGPDGAGPYAGLTFDGTGNLYGTTGGGGASNDGTVFELALTSKGKWKETVLHSFTKPGGANPYAPVVLDAAGNLYGTTTYGGGADDGLVFRLAPRSGGGWTYSVLHDFTGKPAIHSYAGLVLGQAHRAYGTTAYCANGEKCRGVVFEVVP